MENEKEIDKALKQAIKESKKALKGDLSKEDAEVVQASINAFTSLLDHKNKDEKKFVFDAIGKIQLLQEELMFLSMLKNLFLSNAISVEQFAKQVKTTTNEEYEEYVKRFRKAYADLDAKGVFSNAARNQK